MFVGLRHPPTVELDAFVPFVDAAHVREKVNREDRNTGDAALGQRRSQKETDLEEGEHCSSNDSHGFQRLTATKNVNFKLKPKRAQTKWRTKNVGS